MAAAPTPLSPSQTRSVETLAAYWPVANVLHVYGDTGMGKTTILRSLHNRFGGTMLGLEHFVDAMREHHPLAIEETFQRRVMAALASADTVLVDDLHVLTKVGVYTSTYPRAGLLVGVLDVVTAWAVSAGKHIVFGSDGGLPGSAGQRAFSHGVGEHSSADYEFIVSQWLGPERAAAIDFRKVHRFAPNLNGYQLAKTCAWLGSGGGSPTTEKLIEYLRALGMSSNVNLGEVEPVRLQDLKGMDDLIASLEAKIILPLENDQLATELGIEPKRGVLIAGPPGTGKTTVGRALAHRLKSKFFLVDGTIISGTRNFYHAIQRLFREAERNAPSIIFIDDSDVMFENSHETGFYRYLLTMLDGLESEKAGQVCVMMTAMDVGNLPPALVRSGRIELWLETRLPDQAAREAILRGRLAGLPAAFAGVDAAAIAEASETMTGADLRQLVDDGKLLYAHDKVRGRLRENVTGYFLEAVATVRNNRERYAKAEQQARARRQKGPAWFSVEQIADDECG
ncbi:MAG TPA: ATP-binding protein [Planctomycetota bacterium]